MLSNTLTEKVQTAFADPALEEERWAQGVFDQCVISGCNPVPPDDYTFVWGQIGFTPRRNLTMLKAPAKAGKTFALTALTTAYLSNNYGGLCSTAMPGDSVIYFDTEQAKSDTQKLYNRIAKHADASRLVLLNLLGLSPAERLKLIEIQCRRIRPKLVVIDGVADLVPGMDYNDLSMSDEIVARLYTLADEIDAAIICAIHTNKNAENRSASGWLGRVLLQKCSTEIEVVKEKESAVRRMECGCSRHREFAPIPFQIVDTADHFGDVQIVTVEDCARTEKEKRAEEIREQLIASGIVPPIIESAQNFKQRLKEELAINGKKGCRKDTAEKFLKESIETGVLRLDGDNVLFGQK